MTSLVLDLSQTVINRTAMYFISMDIARTLEGNLRAYQYFGEMYSRTATQDDEARLKERFGRLMGLADRGEPERFGELLGSARHAVSNSWPRFYLDPLYVMFSRVSEQDTVMLLDMSTVTTPEWHRPSVALLYDAAFTRIAKTAPNLVAISQNTADAYVANFGYPRKPIKIVPLYVPAHLRSKVQSGTVVHAASPYFLFVGSLEARKNVTGAIEAFRISKLAEQGYQLLIVGGHGHGGQAIESLVARTPNVSLRGYVSNEELHGLYAGATGFVYPSYLEGFGVPLLEAMLYGLPAVASFTGACREVGGDAVAYCNPDDHPGFATEMLRIAALTAGERAAISARSRARVDQGFSYSAFQTNLRDAVLRG